MAVTEKIFTSGQKKGSGGVGFLIKNDVMKQFSIMVEDDTIEGILWLKLSSQLKNVKLHIGILYLPQLNLHETLTQMTSLII